MGKYDENKHNPRFFKDEEIKPELLDNQQLMSEIFDIVKMEIELRASLSRFGNVIQSLRDANIVLEKNGEVIIPIAGRTGKYWDSGISGDDRVKMQRVLHIKE